MAEPFGPRRPAERVWSRLPAGARPVLADELSPTDLQSLQLDLARVRANRVTPSRLRQRWRDDRFVTPSPTDPRQLAATGARLWQLLPAAFEGLSLSPVTPLGTCAAVADVDQNRVLSTVRSTEVVSDATNVLALAAADRRQRGSGPVHLAACHRLLRTQMFQAPALAHFELFSLVSTGRDQGSGRTEAELLIMHLRFWGQVLTELLGPSYGRLDLTVINNPIVADRVADTVRPALDDSRLQDAPDRTQGIGYYHSAAFKIMAGDAGEIELGDGGFTGWTAALLADAKERCLISCISTERLTQLIENPR